VVEVPLRTWADVGKSKLQFRHMLGVPIDLLKIHLHHNPSPFATCAEAKPIAALPKQLPEAPLR
jgi:hypothetical protein